MEISFAAEKIGEIGGVPITNSFITSIFASLLLVSFSFFISRRLNMIPGKVQNVTENIVETLYMLNTQIAGKRTAFIFPWFATFFLSIVFANWLGLLPGFGTVGFFQKEGHFVPLLRPVNSDLNITLSLALISIAVTHFFSIKVMGIKEYLGRFFSLNPINLFVGILELVSEFTKVASLSFRLFGNIFAGEALLVTVSKISAFSAFIIPIPFMMLELVVGLVQGLVFAMLTLVFMVILTTSHKEGGG
ncbi:F0F1 ATP synthase subunit A [Candidatus Microgenomates bacterium]|nr:F0F1 ATP synthase subunit A [Candidatus Microgenomates bacterium]